MTVPDNTGCTHKLDGLITTREKWEIGRCGICGNQVALQVDESGKYTGRSLLIEGSIDST